MEHFYENVRGWFSFKDLYNDIVQYFPDGSHFVEVGSMCGQSSVYMAVEIINSNKNIKFDCVDIWVEPNDQIEFLKNITPVSHIINVINLLSDVASKLYEDESLDFVFIDADHTYDQIFNDINAWLPKIKKNGILAGHDYNFNGVQRAVDEILGNKNIKFDTDGVSWIYEKGTKRKFYKMII